MSCGESDFERVVRERVNCCACGCPLPADSRINLVSLQRRATWKHPTAGNVLTGWGPAAVAIVCDGCVEGKATIHLAVEIEGREVRYHRGDELEKLPPEPTYVLRTAGSGATAIECLRCGSLSFNPGDVANKYCGGCHQFHEG